MDEVLIVNKSDFELKKKIFLKGSANSIQVVSDFDKTLTTAVYNGTKTNTAISQMRQNNLLGEEYAKKSFALFDMYHPIEIDPAISQETKIPLMEEWWANHLRIIVEYGMNRRVVNKVIAIQSNYLRKGTKRFFTLLSKNDVPVLILSSALGDVIEGVLKVHNLLTNNVHVISNYFEFDKKRNAIGYKGKIVHVFNKDESQIQGTPYYDKIASRKNVILLGDSLGDLKMVGQIPYSEIIKIGFLVENVDSQLEEFKKNFDVILLGDGSLDFVNELLQELLSKNKN
ncbi:MAG: hypothetical protein WCW44_02565 [archaeon]